ncbi:M20/M25/M40 family metallo-hydrolase [Sphingomonas sp.]|jgi:Zn-dependent M28 family amino/carboxypeptidase|uniref:M20/M25/M40 family metallo-hydrolase n=1 Tax=Sphingomonas sp. TaxID=28214 RepID=UPI002E375F20|nr:M20/M25/M40 family metallo-hydrolase [Sphingomonas sp.]HEX4693520.1 M20/M25/M40 family metallo-hydrolase [Sphingomonas sp.]
MRIAPIALAGIAAIAVPAIAQRALPGAVKVDPAVAKARDAALKDDVAYDIVEGLTTEVGQRLAGTEAEARARAWAVVKLKALGFKNVHIETYTMPVWVRGEEKAEIVGPYPQKLTLAALGRSGATPPAGITAPVVYFPTFNDLLAAPDGSLTGKIAFISNQMKTTQDGSGYGEYGAARFVGPNIAAKKGAVAVIIRSIGTDHGRWPHTGGTNWTPGVTPIPAAALSVADAEQLERIFARTDKVSLHLTLTPRTLPDAESGTVVAKVPGTDPKAGTIVVGGHLDSWDLATGAIDDGAGVAITTAAAKRLLDGPRPRRTIRVVWFGAEEPGGFGGAAYAKAHAGETFAMAGESDFGADNIWRFNVNFPDSAKAIGDRIGVALAPLGITRGREVAGDGTDVGPLFKLGVSAVDLNQSGTRYFDWHHTAEDTLDKIDPEQLRQNVAAWTAVLWIVANAPEDWGKATPKD